MKTDRAEVHLQELEAEVAKFIEDDPYVITSKDNVKRHWHVLRIEVKPLPEVIAALVGEFAYCLRSALDQLAWQLALKHVVRPRSATSFPIRGTRPAIGFGDATRDIIPAAVAVIESLQPYQRGDAFRDHPLWILNELCIIDKHATPVINATAFSYRIHGTEILRRRELGYGSEVTVSLSDKFKVQFDPDPPEIVFGKPVDAAGPGFEVHIGTLRAIHDFVRNDAIPRFAGFFK